MTCKLSAIVAVCDDWGIGRDGRMLVENRADMRHFVSTTTGHAVIMGRKTLDSLPGGRALKDRRNIVLTRDEAFSREGVETVHSVEEALAAVEAEDEAWVIGGAEVYRELLPHCTRAVVTRNRCFRSADTYFPNLDGSDVWRKADAGEPAFIAEGEGDAGVEYSFATYERIAADGEQVEHEDFHLKTMILYRSKHHGNTKKLIDALVEAYPEDIDTLDVSTLGKSPKDRTLDLSGYPLIGVASGIYFGNVDRDLAIVMDNSLREFDTVFGLLTYGGQSKWNGRDIDGICRAKRVNFLAAFGCAGFDTWGPFRFIGGMNKGRPNEQDIEDLLAWYKRLLNEYGPFIQDEYDKRLRRDAWEAAHPDPTLAQKLRNTARQLTGRGKKRS